MFVFQRRVLARRAASQRRRSALFGPSPSLSLEVERLARSFKDLKGMGEGSIAKILQFATSKKGFGEESENILVLNPFIIKCHDKFMSFFVACCNAAEPEVQLFIDSYTEAVLIAKPSLYISLLRSAVAVL